MQATSIYLQVSIMQRKLNKLDMRIEFLRATVNESAGYFKINTKSVLTYYYKTAFFYINHSSFLTLLVHPTPTTGS